MAVQILMFSYFIVWNFNCEIRNIFEFVRYLLINARGAQYKFEFLLRVFKLQRKQGNAYVNVPSSLVHFVKHYNIKRHQCFLLLRVQDYFLQIPISHILNRVCDVFLLACYLKPTCVVIECTIDSLIQQSTGQSSRLSHDYFLVSEGLEHWRNKATFARPSACFD